MGMSCTAEDFKRLLQVFIHLKLLKLTKKFTNVSDDLEFVGIQTFIVYK